MKKLLFCIILCFTALLSACSTSKTKLYLLNFGDYVDPEVVKEFEKENNCQVVIDVFEANEEAIPLLRKNPQYDLVCLSEYAVEQLLSNDLFEDISDKPVWNEINDDYKELMYDVDQNKYALPYFWGSEGIVYNKTALEKLGLPLPTKWEDLWNKVYKDNLIMTNSLRDIYSCVQYKNGFSQNTKDQDEIRKCTEDLIQQKPLVQCYVVDQIKEKILSGEGLIAPLLDGDMQYILDAEPKDDIRFILPEGKLGLYIDNWCMLKHSQNKGLAYKFLEFLYKSDKANANAGYVGYQSCNKNVNGEDYLLMMQENKFEDLTNGTKELERDLGNSLDFYVSEFNRLKGE